MMIPFAKMSGAGNTFVVIDNRDAVLEAALAEHRLGLDRFIIRICSPTHGAGTDGVILIEQSKTADFSWRFFNADGSHANMCGNGARCAARFARLEGVTEDVATFETGAGIIHSHVDGATVSVSLTPPGELSRDISLQLGGEARLCHLIDTGVPHLVVPVKDIQSIDVQVWGAEARFHDRFAPNGVNVNFAAQGDDGALLVRTYERGVEGETMACGTGMSAVALVFADLGLTTSPTVVIPLSGERLQIHFKHDNSGFRDVILEGPAQVLFSGRFDVATLV